MGEKLSKSKPSSSSICSSCPRNSSTPFSWLKSSRPPCVFSSPTSASSFPTACHILGSHDCINFKRSCSSAALAADRRPLQHQLSDSCAPALSLTPGLRTWLCGLGVCFVEKQLTCFVCLYFLTLHIRVPTILTHLHRLLVTILLGQRAEGR